MTVPIPSAKVQSVTHTLHGRERDDEYAWMKDDRWQEVMRDPSLLAPDIRDYLEKENAYTADRLAATNDLQSQLTAQMRARIKEDDSSVPSPDGQYEYYVRFREGGQHPLVCRRTVDTSDGEELLLDGDALSKKSSYFHLGDFGHSVDHRLFAWSEDTNGSEIYRIRFSDASSARVLDDVVENASGAFEWAADSRSILYTVLDDNHRPCKVMSHRLGEAAESDRMIYEESDAGFFVGVNLSESRRYLIVDAHDHVTSEVRLVDSRRPDDAPMLIAARDPGVEYSVSDRGDRIYLLTNADGAEDFKIVSAPTDAPDRENWEDFVPHRHGTLIVAMQMFSEFLVRLERVEGLPRIIVRELSSSQEHAIEFDEEAYSLGLAGGYEFDTRILRFTYSSMTTPEQVFDYDMGRRTRVLRKTQEVPSGHDPEHYVTRRLFALAHDGERIPLSILHHRDTAMDGSSPLLLVGYGAYGISIPAAFSTARLSMVDRGFVYCIAHIRGGMERGYRWYKQGKLEHKCNTFLDFASAAEHLISLGIARARNIAAQGGSAGGMLMGVMANARPELFKAIVAEVPFVDVLNTMCDADLPLTPPEWPEWGNPIEDESAYQRIAGYSPYDNVRAGRYPHILVTAGLTDPRVTYWEPAKWVARLRRLKTDQNLLLLKTNMSAGHAGAAGRFEQLEETALVYAFLLMVFDRL